MTPDQLNEIKVTWLPIITPPPQMLPQSIGEATITTAKADIVMLIAEVESLWARRTQVQRIIRDAYFITHEGGTPCK